MIKGSIVRIMGGAAIGFVLAGAAWAHGGLTLQCLEGHRAASAER